MTNMDQRGFLHLGETQGVESDPQNSGSWSIQDLPEDPGPLFLCLIVPEEICMNKHTVSHKGWNWEICTGIIFKNINYNIQVAKKKKVAHWQIEACEWKNCVLLWRTSRCHSSLLEQARHCPPEASWQNLPQRRVIRPTTPGWESCAPGEMLQSLTTWKT